MAFMLFGGKYSHAVLKKAKAGDFRVHEDYGGSVHEYMASKNEMRILEILYQEDYSTEKQPQKRPANCAMMPALRETEDGS